jgi:hypothetical protein
LKAGEVDDAGGVGLRELDAAVVNKFGDGHRGQLLIAHVLIFAFSNLNVQSAIYVSDRLCS